MTQLTTTDRGYSLVIAEVCTGISRLRVPPPRFGRRVIDFATMLGEKR